MLYAFGFDEVGVVVGDLYIVDPDPLPGQAGPERGVRIEVRMLSRQPLVGDIYSAQPILVGRPLWRADLLEAVDHPGTLDRAHHHPTFDDRWSPCERVFEPDLSADPVRWVGRRLAAEFEGVAGAVPEILDVVRRLLDRVRAGELGRAPSMSPPSDGAAAGEGVRASWL